MESWLSGRKRLTANEVGCKSPREFESRTLRFVFYNLETYGVKPLTFFMLRHAMGTAFGLTRIGHLYELCVLLKLFKVFCAEVAHG